MGGRRFKRWCVAIGVFAISALVLATAPRNGPASSQATRQHTPALQPAPELAEGALTPTPEVPLLAQSAQMAPKSGEKDNLVDKGLFKPIEAAVQGKTARGQTILDAPAFTVPPRKPELELYPCTDCHDGEEINPTERTLEEEHADLALEHGGGRFWCLTCHNLKARDTLTSLKDKPIDFNQSFLVCGQCHFQRQKDWYFGGHGQRIGTWLGPRVIRNCTECHDPHSPSIKPFEPSPPPKVRTGLVNNINPPERHPENWELRIMEKGGRP